MLKSIIPSALLVTIFYPWRTAKPHYLFQQDYVDDLLRRLSSIAVLNHCFSIVAKRFHRISCSFAYSNSTEEIVMGNSNQVNVRSFKQHFVFSFALASLHILI